MDQNKRVFKTKQDAFNWMIEHLHLDGPNVANRRFAFLDDHQALLLYEDIRDHGCCGFFDVDVEVAGRKASVGCNYGHDH